VFSYDCKNDGTCFQRAATFQVGACVMYDECECQYEAVSVSTSCGKCDAIGADSLSLSILFFVSCVWLNSYLDESQL
jgi:hypothetical protein